MELQQQGMPRYGLYGSHYDQAQGFPGQGRHPLSGGYPFPPMPGQNYSGYPHLGYPSSQSPNPREGKISDLLIPVVCVCQPRFWTCAISGRFDYFLKFAYTQDIFCLLINSNGAGVIPVRVARDSLPGPESEPLIPKWRLFAITAILPIIHSASSACVWHALPPAPTCEVWPEGFNIHGCNQANIVPKNR